MATKEEKIVSSSASDALERIERLLELYKYIEAMAELTKVEKEGNLRPHSLILGKFYYLSSIALHGLGRFEDSLKKGAIAYELLVGRTEYTRLAQMQLVMSEDNLALGRLKDARYRLMYAARIAKGIEEYKDKARINNSLEQIDLILSRCHSSIHNVCGGSDDIEESNNKINPIMLQQDLGMIFALRGQLDLAERHLLFTTKLAKAEGYELRLCLGNCLCSLGHLKTQRREFRKASSYLRKAFQLIWDGESLSDLAFYYQCQGELFFYEKKLDQAEACYWEAVRTGERISSESVINGRAYGHLGELELERKDIQKALEYINKSIDISTQFKDKLGSGIGYRILGEILNFKNDMEGCRFNLKRSVDLLEEIGVRYELIKTCLALAYSHGFDYQERLDHMEKAKGFSVSLGIKHLEGLAEGAHGLIEFQHGKFENSLCALEKAEKISTELKDEHMLSFCREMREQVERSLTQKSLSAENEFRAFRLLLAGSPYHDVGDLSLDDSLRVLVQNVSAERGMVVSADPRGNDLYHFCLHNMEFHVAKNLLDNLLHNNAFNSSSVDAGYKYSKPLVLTHTSSIQKHLGDIRVKTLLLIPLVNKDKPSGFIYIDRVSRDSFFSQKELNFAVAFSDFISLKLYELEKKILEEDNLRLRQTLGDNLFPQFITCNSIMGEVLWKLHQVKDTNLTILLEGETGSGKDFLAKTLHYSSNRKDKNFTAVNCSALPEPLLESELFGHKKGAYTGATFDKKGLFEEADGGTLYLDEIADLSPSIQVKLLRVLEEKVITRLGEIKQRKIDIRIVASTNKNLDEEVAKGRFRKDLYFRLNTIKLKLLSLRERKEDIPLLVDHFISKHSDDDQRARSLRPLMLKLYSEYDWPGNVRELENETKRLLAYRQSGEDKLESLYLEKLASARPDLLASRTLDENVDSYRRKLILESLIENNWSVKSTAQALKIAETTLRYQMKMLKIERPTE